MLTLQLSIHTTIATTHATKSRTDRQDKREESHDAEALQRDPNVDYYHGCFRKYRKGTGKAFYALAEMRLCQITPWGLVEEIYECLNNR